jgi:hypothetical protein
MVREGGTTYSLAVPIMHPEPLEDAGHGSDAEEPEAAAAAAAAAGSATEGSQQPYRYEDFVKAVVQEEVLGSPTTRSSSTSPVPPVVTEVLLQLEEGAEPEVLLHADQGVEGQMGGLEGAVSAAVQAHLAELEGVAALEGGTVAAREQ